MSANKSQALLEVFQEIFAASDGNSTARASLNETQILKVLRASSAGDEAADLEAVILRFLSEARSRLNLSLPPPACAYCEGGFRDVVEAYNVHAHGYICVLLCVVGFVSNSLNVAVLMQRSMSTPIHRFLLWMAFADMVVMFEYIPFGIYRYLVLPGKLDFPYAWAVYILVHMHFGQICHTASICLTVALAVWRYVAIRFADRSHVLCSPQRCRLAIAVSFILPPILCIPTYLVFHIYERRVEDGGGSVTVYHVDSDAAGAAYRANFWIHAVVIKILPSCVLTYIIVWLTRYMYRAHEHEKLLHGAATTATAARRQTDSARRTDRTTKMLIALLALFLLSELPQGVLGLLSGILGWCFFRRCYGLFGEIMDLLALSNGAIGFWLYCYMSTQFRETLETMRWYDAIVSRLRARKADDVKLDVLATTYCDDKCTR